MSDEQILSDWKKEVEVKLGDLYEAVNELESDKANQIPMNEAIARLPDHLKKSFQGLTDDQSIKLGDEHPEGVTPDEQAAVNVIEIAIAKLSPSPEDVVVFWLPAELSHRQVNQIASSFGNVIGDRFRFMVLVRNAIDIEIISGKQSKGGVLLPS